MDAAHCVAAHTKPSVRMTAVVACRMRLRLDGIGASPWRLTRREDQDADRLEICELGFAVKSGHLRAEACSCMKTEHRALRDLACASAFAAPRLRCCRLRKQRKLCRSGGLLQHGFELGSQCDALVAGELGKVLLPPFDCG